MTKQEKIYEGVEAQIRLGMVETTYQTTDAILKYLHSQGVAFIYDIQDPLFGKQWAKFEPLIKE